MPNGYGVCRKRGVRIHKIGLHVYLQVFVAKIFSKKAKLYGTFDKFCFQNSPSGNILLPAKNPKLFECHILFKASHKFLAERAKTPLQS